jgi:hypothetical protein
MESHNKLSDDPESPALSTSSDLSSPSMLEDDSDSCHKSFKLSEARHILLPGPSAQDDDEKAPMRKKKLRRWNAEEDTRLLELFYRFGNDWDAIADSMPGRAASGVKNRFYWICKSSLPASTVYKIKQVTSVQKLYKAPKSSSELFRKINTYLREECLIESLLAIDKPKGHSDLVYKLKMTPEDLENHAVMQGLLEKAQHLYISCEKAKQSLLTLQQHSLCA